MSSHCVWSPTSGKVRASALQFAVAGLSATEPLDGVPMHRAFMPLVEAFHQAANISRATLYGCVADPQMPVHLQEDARTPFLGFCGPSWKSGGTVLLAINPGGGGDAYQNRTPQDAELIPLIRQFMSSTPQDAGIVFHHMCDSYRRQVQSWNLWRILQPTLDACGDSIDEVCYLNIFPYRTVGDAKPAQGALRQAWSLIVHPLLTVLEPGLVVALGKKAGNVAAKLHSPPPGLFVVPRTIGDSYVSPEAHAVLDQLRLS